LATVIIYLITNKFLKKPTHNAIWNTVLLLGLIPSLGFGTIMIFEYQFPSLRNIITFDLLYNHVELSVVFGTACVLHFVFRLTSYIGEMKTVKRFFAGDKK
jgi:hypothetical protein